ncbi:hypothetical protein EXIGLDRAFT_192572 [Exidia glandulosa HHB12029]|uniref:Secreted protein n=1 Tax=Exidia glandulosa HHB12029 TaxID=1314781 RepID=A0A165EX49_EXIGL|nr:hypothetical protein EXIGLDRAFT_192572 [Exidia glandulosa HHB12029]
MHRLTQTFAVISICFPLFSAPLCPALSYPAPLSRSPSAHRSPHTPAHRSRSPRYPRSRSHHALSLHVFAPCGLFGCICRTRLACSSIHVELVTIVLLLSSGYPFSPPVVFLVVSMGQC